MQGRGDAGEQAAAADADEDVRHTGGVLDGHSLATAVALTGSFVGWAGTAPPAISFAKGIDGAWTGSFAFVAGTHQYKYIVDGSWITDPTNPNQVDDTFGGFNSVITCTP